jgi:hypothetical protein
MTPAGGPGRPRRRAFVLEYAGMAWMVAEAAVAVIAVVPLGSLTLTRPVLSRA